MNTKTIYLAGGCFWGTDRLMSLAPGVIATESGYANSCVPHPDYRQVCSGATNAAETVKVTYDPAVISLPELLQLFYLSIDPTAVNRQGNDVGTQYRSGIYYTNPADRAVIDEASREVREKSGNRFAVEILPLENFYPAEDYHQKYLEKNPGGYCHVSRALLNYAASLKTRTQQGEK